MKKLFSLLILLSPISLFSMSDDYDFYRMSDDEFARAIGKNYVYLIESDISSAELDVRIDRICQGLKEEFKAEKEAWERQSEAEARASYYENDFHFYQHMVQSAEWSAQKRFDKKNESLPELKKRILFARQVSAVHKQSAR